MTYQFKFPALLMVFFLVAVACSNNVHDADTSTDTQLSSSDTATDNEFDTETESISDTEEQWVNPGCDGPANVIRDNMKLELEVDLRDWEDGIYHLREKVTMTAVESGNTVSLFGEKFKMGKASAGYSYDEHLATFCTESFEAGEEVTVEIKFDVLSENQLDYGMFKWGLNSWYTNNNQDMMIGPFNEPSYAPLWLMSPQSLTAVDAKHDDSPAVNQIQLSVIVPDEQWMVFGPGAGQNDSNTWNFSIDKPMPIYALSFAASPDYEVFSVGTSKTGVEIVGAVFASSVGAAKESFKHAVTTVDFMEETIGPYIWGDYLALVEAPEFNGGMEHTTVIWMGSSVITPDERGDFVTIHEVVHHWWGDAVRFADWPHFWLAEGFDEWSTNFNVFELINSEQEQARHELEYRIEAGELTYPMGGGDYPGPLRFDDNDSMNSHLVSDMSLFYTYGATFLEMVNQRLIRDFDSLDLNIVLADWFDLKQGSEATTEEFLAFLEDVTEDDDATYWKPLFDDWVYKTPCPRLYLTNWAYENQEATFVISRGGGLQNIEDLEIELKLGDEKFKTTVDLPTGTNQAELSVVMPAEADSIAIDSKLFYVLLLNDDNWTGPTVNFAHP